MLSSLHLVPLRAGIYVGVLALGIAAVSVIRKYPRNWRPNRDIFFQEAVFFSAFALAAFFLMHKPEIYFGYSEDFMNSAFLQSILRADFLPLSDPWYAGASLPYYYFGHLAAAVLVLLSGVKAEIGYNLAVAGFFAVGVQAAFGIGINLAEKRLYGLLAVFLTLVAGFPAGFLQILGSLCDACIQGSAAVTGSIAAVFESFDFTAATWVLPDANTFYPFFTFLQGDLHAHFLAIPFLLALIGLCIALSRRFSLATLTAALAVAGFLVGTNAWTFPAALLLIALTAYYATRQDLFLGVIVLAGCVFLTLVLSGMVGMVGLGQGTSLPNFLLLFGCFALVSIAYLVDGHTFSSRDLFLAVVVILVLVISYAFHFPVAVLALLALPFFHRAFARGEYPAMLAGIALLLILFSEVFFINDPLGPPLERMNTVMKLYLQAWVFWGVASAYFVSRTKNRALVVGAAVLIAVMAVHPACTLLAMPGAEFMGGTEEMTLDGSAWLREQKPDEYNALSWLRETAGDGDVVLEAPGDAYTYSSRVGPFTGLPTIIGWRTHEIMWGRDWKDVDLRSADADCMYLGEGDTDALLAKYNVRYILLGETEWMKYGSKSGNLTRRDSVRLVFRSGTTEIYKVVSIANPVVH